jgi:hypothetical protein
MMVSLANEVSFSISVYRMPPDESVIETTLFPAYASVVLNTSSCMIILCLGPQQKNGKI